MISRWFLLVLTKSLTWRLTRSTSILTPTLPKTSSKSFTSKKTCSASWWWRVEFWKWTTASYLLMAVQEKHTERFLASFQTQTHQLKYSIAISREIRSTIHLLQVSYLWRVIQWSMNVPLLISTPELSWLTASLRTVASSLKILLWVAKQQAFLFKELLPNHKSKVTKLDFVDHLPSQLLKMLMHILSKMKFKYAE